MTKDNPEQGGEKNPLRVAVAGLGTVGQSVVSLLSDNADLIARRAGRPIIVTDVSARDRKKNRAVSLDGLQWWDDAAVMAEKAKVDVVVELIGGEDGKAKDLAEITLAHKKALVTANKALLAHHGYALALMAEENGVDLRYEAAVAGGIPIIKAIREGLAGVQTSRIYGILNGTCNYILSLMRESGASFEEALSQAQDLGYAEADPAFDIEGTDSAHKLCLLTALAFGVRPDFAAIRCRGITDIEAVDIQAATQLGYRIKLLGMAEQTADGTVLQSVEPALVPIESPIAAVEGVFNGVVAECAGLGDSLYEGRGAGGDPTASAVVADLIDLAAGRKSPVFGCPVKSLRDPLAQNSKSEAEDSRAHGYYLRLRVIDRPGVVAEIAAILRDESISMSSIYQQGRAPHAEVDLVLTTHEIARGAICRGVEAINALEAVTRPPQLLRVESFADS